MSPNDLTKEQTLKAHRALWTWIAEETEKTGRIPDKSDFKHPEYPNPRGYANICYACDYAKKQAQKENPYLPYIEIEDRCPHCPLQWPDEYYDEEITPDNFTSCTTENYEGLFDQWSDLKRSQTNPEQAAKIARQIANLPERSETQ